MSDLIEEKLIIVGLDNAGKSTIILTMKQKARLRNIIELEPTKGIATETIETIEGKVHVWDFGGQEKYRESYLSKPEFFESTDKMIFVIDIQDESRFERALQYLEQILKLMKGFATPTKHIIFLHKFDPDLLETQEYQERSKKLRKKLRILFEEYDYSFDVYHTSIYTVFQRIKVM